jgi:integrase
MAINKLTDTECRNAMPNGDKPAMLSDGLGLYLQVTPSRKAGNPPARSWVFLYKNQGSKKTLLGLGSLAHVSLSEARSLAKVQRDLIDRGTDPKAEKSRLKAKVVFDANAQQKVDKAIKVAATTFAQCAAAYIATKKAAKWNATHQRQWEYTIGLANRAFGDKSVADIDQDDVLNLLRPIWNARPVTANRLRARIEAVLYDATANKLRTGDNPAVWNLMNKCGLLSPSEIKKVIPQPALQHGKVMRFLRQVRNDPRVAARALELIVLTAVRRNEAVKAQWKEFDFSGNIWTIPEERMRGKGVNRKEHKVPMSTSVVAMLQAIRPENAQPDDYVFPQYKATWIKPRPIDSDAPYKICKGIDPTITLRGMRSCFRDWCDETLNPNPQKMEDGKSRVEFAVAEKCLAHVVGGTAGRVYARRDMLDLRRPVMESWAKYCDGAVAQLRAVAYEGM